MKRTALALIASAAVLEVITMAAGVEHYFSKTIVSAGFSGLLLAALCVPPVIRMLSYAWLRYIGTISYGIYLLHLIVAAGVITVWPGTSWPIRIGRAAVTIAGSIMAASLSWRLLEQPALRLKAAFPVETDSFRAKTTVARAEPSTEVPVVGVVPQSTL